MEYLSVVFWCIYKSTDYKVSAEAYGKISFILNLVTQEKKNRIPMIGNEVEK